MLGSVEFDYNVVSALCEDLAAVVVWGGYRLAPDHPYPAGLSDCGVGLPTVGARTY